MAHPEISKVSIPQLPAPSDLSTRRNRCARTLGRDQAAGPESYGEDGPWVWKMTWVEELTLIETNKAGWKIHHFDGIYQEI